jgi:hypothetical protein
MECGVNTGVKDGSLAGGLCVIGENLVTAGEVHEANRWLRLLKSHSSSKAGYSCDWNSPGGVIGAGSEMVQRPRTSSGESLVE